MRTGPSRPRARATANPIPPVPPVTTARLDIVFYSFLAVRDRGPVVWTDKCGNRRFERPGVA
ncbi:hypothetical protein GCM10009645_14040 [Mycolicibacterium poriferae]|uniref:Uncharacterized protein n=1 Tax=Mycolicibacterium poriferae TaxID=39694 RepID=A0A6N4VA68_9MYCO|nr:hypothetical protein MPOR_35420 [Mycolicibacterium poriferae]